MEAWAREFQEHMLAALLAADQQLTPAELSAALVSVARSIEDLARQRGTWDAMHFTLCLEVGHQHFAALARELADA